MCHVLPTCVLHALHACAAYGVGNGQVLEKKLGLAPEVITPQGPVNGERLCFIPLPPTAQPALLALIIRLFYNVPL